MLTWSYTSTVLSNILFTKKTNNDKYPHLGHSLTSKHAKCTEQAEHCLGKFWLARVNFEHVRFLSRMAKILSSMLYQAVRGNIILAFPGYVTLPSIGNFTQTDVVYPAWVWFPSLGMVTQPEYGYPSWVKLPRLGKITQSG